MVLHPFHPRLHSVTTLQGGDCSVHLQRSKGEKVPALPRDPELSGGSIRAWPDLSRSRVHALDPWAVSHKGGDRGQLWNILPIIRLDGSWIRGGWERAEWRTPEWLGDQICCLEVWGDDETRDEDQGTSTWRLNFLFCLFGFEGWMPR